MVERQGQRNRGASLDLAVDNERSRLDHAQGEDRRFGMIDDRCPELGSKGPDVGDGDRASHQLLRLRPASPGGLGEAGDLLGERHDPQRVRVSHDRDQKAVLGVGGDPDVVAAVKDDLLPLGVERRVQLGVFLAHLDQGLDHDGKGGDPPIASPGQLLSEGLECGGVHCEERGDLRDLSRGPRHLLGDQAAGPSDLDPFGAPFLGRCGCRRAAVSGRSENVLPGHPAARTGA
jgi:hypothetical protein